MQREKFFWDSREGEKTQQEFRHRCWECLNLGAGFLQPQQVPFVWFIFFPFFIEKKTLCSPWLECPVVEVPPKGRINNIYLKHANGIWEIGLDKSSMKSLLSWELLEGLFFPTSLWCCGAVVVTAWMWRYPGSQRNIFSFFIFLKENYILLATLGGLF